MNVCEKCGFYFKQKKKCLCTEHTDTAETCEKVKRVLMSQDALHRNKCEKLTKQDACVFNLGVVCYTNERQVMNCAVCGWNPTEYERRKNNE